jgi:hypothetical protein
MATLPVGNDDDYDLEKDPNRHWVRTFLAYLLTGTTVVIGLTLLIVAVWKHIDVNPQLTGIFTPFFGLTGTIVGFYFGGRKQG